MNREYEAPYLRAAYSTRTIMRDLVLALMPPLFGAFYFFGIRALWMTVFSAVVCVISEYTWQKIRRDQITAGDFSAAATGILMAFHMPVTTPFWALAIGDVFAVVVVKQMFGGIGNNFVNPALMGRLLLMTVWPGTAMQYVNPGNDAVSAATALSLAKSQRQQEYTYLQMFLGDIPGAVGETSKLLILIGFGYLWYRGIVNVKAAFVYIATVAGLTYAIGPNGWFSGDFFGNLLGGGLIMGGCYMLTDYAFVSGKEKLWFALTAGVITALIRIFSVYPEGVCFGILTANCLAGFLATFEKHPVYGVFDRQKKQINLHE